MGRPDFPRRIVEFQERFSDEAACLEYLAASRWPEGYRCPACGGERAWVLERRHLWECARLPPADLGDGGDGDAPNPHPVAALVLGGLPGRHPHPGDLRQAAAAPARASRRYETAWLILQKLRRAMIAPERRAAEGRGRDRRVLRRRAPFLSGAVGAERGAARRWSAVAVEVRGRGSGGCGSTCSRRPRGEHARGLGSSEIVEPGAIVHTDGWSGYGRLARSGYDHRPAPAAPARTADRQFILPRADRAISNLKTWLHGTHRGVSSRAPAGLPRRVRLPPQPPRTPMAAFQTLLGLGALHEPTTYREITGSRRSLSQPDTQERRFPPKRVRSLA